MAWKHPERIPRTGEVVSHRDLNSATQPFVEEDGRLNEQNWSAAMAGTVTRADLAADVAFRVLHESNVVDASEQTSGTEINATLQWVPLEVDGTNSAFSFTSRGGTLCIFASVQMSIKGQAGGWTDGVATTSAPRTDIVHGLFGIRVDGALSTISVVGDQDSLSEGANMETGVSGYVQGVEVETTMPVAPGQHTVEVVAKTETLPTSTDESSILVYSTELLVWEIR